MQRLNTLNKEYEPGEVLSDENLDQIVSYINQSINAINELIDGNNINSGHYEIRYKDSLLEPSPPSTGSSGLSDGWRMSIDSVVYSVWMTQCFVTVGNTYGTWTKPIKLSGKDGNNGSFVQEVYRNDSATGVNSNYIPTVINNNYSNPAFPPEGWTTVIQDRTEEQHTWCIQRTISFNENNISVYGKWSIPFRITGDNGKDGEDGKYLEFIYKHFASEQTWGQGNSNPANWSIQDTSIDIQSGQENRSNPQREDYIGPSEQGWSDNPQGVDDVNKYEYVCQRIYDGKNYKSFSSPILWSKYGDRGRDGDGYEYIFKGGTSYGTHPNQINNPDVNSIGLTKDDDDFVPIGWSDDPVTLTEELQYIWVSTRKRKGSNSWGEFSDPKIWAHWADKGTNGGHWEFIYINSKTTPARPQGGTSILNLTGGWSTIVSTPDIANGYHTWMSQCFVSGEGVYGEWTLPIRITGEDGQPGTDGDLTEFIYTRNNTGVAPSVPPSNGTYPRDWPNDGTVDHQTDGNGVTWYDNPQGVASNMMYEYVSTRSYNGTTKTWGNYSSPVIWSKWGEKGQDGDGYEYIYKLGTTYGTHPKEITTKASDSVGNTKSDDDFVPDGWNDEPLTLSSGAPIEWVSVRKKTNQVWGDFSDPKVWAHWADKGSNGGHWEFLYKASATNPGKPGTGVTSSQAASNGWSTQPPQYNGIHIWMTQCFVDEGTYGTWTDSIRITGENGYEGADGSDIEFIYTRKTTLWANPAAPQASGSGNNRGFSDDDWYGLDSNGVTWTDNPQGVDESNMYEYVSQRIKPAGKNQSWGSFSTPVIWSKYGEKGQDGDGYEYIFRGFSSEINDWTSYPDDYPPNWTNNTEFSDPEYYGPSGHVWSDDPVSVDSTNNKFVYVSMRRRKKVNGVMAWQAYSTPALWAQYVAPGTTGQNGSFTQFIYKTTSTDLSISSNYSELNVGQNSISTIPTGWSESTTQPNSSSESIWGSHRLVTYNTSNVATYNSWCAPYRISADSSNSQNTIVYQIVADVAEIKYRKNHANVNVWRPSTVNISVYKFEGTSFTEVSSFSNGTTIRGKINGTNNISVSIGSNNSSQLAVYSTTNNGETTSNVGSFVEIYLQDSNDIKICSMKLPITREYQRMLIPMGAYTNKKYSKTDTTVPLVLGSDGTYYYLDADTNEVSSSNVAPTDTGQTVWAAATEYEVILTKALFADFAKLGSFIIYGDYFFSQYGTLYYNNNGNIEKTTIDGNNYSNQFGNNTPYGWFDPSDPLARNNPDRGEYKFKPSRGINAKTGEDWGAAGNLHMEPQGDVYINGTIVSQGTSNSRWEISPEVYNSIAIPRIVGYSTNGNEKIILMFDADDSDLYNVSYGGGLFFIRQEQGTNVMSGGYFQNRWEIACSDYGKTDQNTNTTRGSYIQCLPEYSNPRLCLYDNYNGNTKSLAVAVNYQGAYLQSSNWMSKSNATNGCTYVDDWGNVKVKRSSGYDQFNFISSGDIITLPSDNVPDGTVFFVKRTNYIRSLTRIMNAHNREYWPKTGNYYQNTDGTGRGFTHIFFMQTIDGNKVWVDGLCSNYVYDE